MLFGSRGKPKSLFPTIGGVSQAPSGGGTPPIYHQPDSEPTDGIRGGMEAMQPKKPGVNWLGVLADALAGAAGQPGQYLAGIQQQQQRAAALADEQRKRSLDMSDWQAKQEWSIKNAPPKTNDTIDDFNWYKGLNEQDRAVYLQMRPQYRQGPDGQFYPIAPQAAPRSYTDDDWNSAKPVGGGVGNVPGGFPR